MDKLKMQTVNKADEKFKKLAAMFPNAVTETIDENGEVVRAIDKDVLMQEISCKVVDGNEERYQFTWSDKKKSVLLANAPINKTLRPVRDDETTPTGADSEGKLYCGSGSVDFDNTENLYIEGDNLEVLKLLQETYLSKIKMIYIDPPYNTGNDFVYEDDFAQSTEEYLENSGQFDEDGNRMVQNTESNGRFHTDWLNMIYPRLKLAKALLTDDGVIFISIDDNELENIKKCCEEVFGESNFLANIVWKHTQQSKNDEPHFSRQYNHTLVYAKMKSSLPNFYFKRTEEDNKNYSNPDADPKGMWRSGDVRSPNYRKTLRYTITAPNGNIIQPPTNGWRWSEESLRDKISTGEIKFKSDNSGIIRKIYLCDQPGRTPENLWEGQQFGTTRQAASLIKNLFDGVQVFDTPKPIELIKKGIRADKLYMFKNNPEEFITKVIRLINEQKATMIVEHISYDTIEGEYDSTIFTAEKNTQSFDKAFLAKKAIQDYVFTDGSAEQSIERRFAEDLDAAEEVCVYAKLPRTFQIPTPVGNYSPDWAIAFYEGTVKHIFFVAETKGTMETLNLRPIEQAKISCAKKLFNEMSNSKVVYHDVDSYQSLLNIMNSI